MTEHLPTTFSVFASTPSAKQDIVTTFEAFVPIFGSTGNFGSDSPLLKLIDISLASTINLEATVAVVTHTSFADLDRLKEITNKFDHVRLAVYSDDVVQYNSSNWVQLIESFKIAHLLENRFKNLLYIELDMIFLPDAGHAFRQIYARVDWDVGFTYLAKRGSFGSTNTGIILFRSISDWTILFLENVRKGIPKKARGGENQRSIDLFIPHLKYNQIYQLDLDKLKQRHQIRILALQYPGPLNYNCIGCCELPPGIHVAHFKALKKNLALSSCCRDLAFPPTRNRSYMAQRMRGIWKESCECKQKHFSRPAFCMPSNKSNPIRNGTSWCKT
eukprot:symbB.v1.2.017136.t1/scaffold1268.1/size213459/17